MSQTPAAPNRSRKTRPSVLFANKAASWIISLGGIGTIIAVMLVGIYLIWVTMPLFTPPDIQPSEQEFTAGASVHVAVDEYRTIGWRLDPEGTVVVFSMVDGDEIRRIHAPDSSSVSQVAFSPYHNHLALGYEDGRVATGQVAFTTNFPGPDAVPESAREGEIGSVHPMDGGLVQRVERRRWRLQGVEIAWQDPVQAASEAAVVTLDVIESGNQPILIAYHQDHTLSRLRTVEETNILTGETTVSFSTSGFQLPNSDHGVPKQALLLQRGVGCVLVWEDGAMERYQLPSGKLMERLNVFPERLDDRRVTTARLALGSSTLLIGDNRGEVHGWFGYRPTDPDLAPAPDDQIFEHVKRIDTGNDSPVTAIGGSPRRRIIAIGQEDGHASLFFLTNERELGSVRAAGPVRSFNIAPKEDLLLVQSGQQLQGWELQLDHPETSFRALFLDIWYEGYEGPDTVWQSSSASDDAEMKLSLWPLVVGTLKATLYAMVFAVPIAIAAAIYSAEFLNPRVKRYIKPMVEFMASLPSVVLGYMAGIILAPVLAEIVPATLAAFLTIPLAFMLGGYCWQMMPRHKQIAGSHYRFFLMIPFLGLGLVVAAVLGPIAEELFFWVETAEGGRRGDIVRWLSGAPGASGLGGWLIPLAPLSLFLAFWIKARHVSPLLEAKGKTTALSEMGLFLGTLVVAGGIALLLALVAAAVIDPRQGMPGQPDLLGDYGSFIGTYVSRNALLLGIAMGFAVIPIIYTISEDALSTVPANLRAASLGAGATTWQTAVRIIIPTAASGLFSATMIGLGRAVGETMIVLMASGNTAIKDLNMFNGLRTLAANIATELPEAVQFSTHYRVLFLSALLLFVMTFILNTLAELVRQRFRKRAVAL